MDDSSLTSSDNEVFTIYYLKYLHKGKISDTIEVANFVNNIVIVKVFKLMVHMHVDHFAYKEYSDMKEYSHFRTVDLKFKIAENVYRVDTSQEIVVPKSLPKDLPFPVGHNGCNGLYIDDFILYDELNTPVGKNLFWFKLSVLD
ncbi:hypothetical protein H8356DRAFT_1333015 [Neocallimastix lanati (nom. inval.)]|nr:hypothetical protein H8356DRAFT_1333015 [Neocallimastix sp. JGI-2020a]